MEVYCSYDVAIYTNLFGIPFSFHKDWEGEVTEKGEGLEYHVVSAASLPPFCLTPAPTFIKISPVLSSTLTGYDV